LDAQCLPTCSPQLHAVIYEEVSHVLLMDKATWWFKNKRKR
jgi:hypothetical protein